MALLHFVLGVLASFGQGPAYPILLTGSSLSLSPGKYDGARALERAFDDFRAGRLENNRTGVMIHYVIAQVDRGDPILTQEVECLEGDTLERLEERTHEVEHELLVRATAKVIEEIAAMRR